jgi:hypothetical protein
MIMKRNITSIIIAVVFASLFVAGLVPAVRAIIHCVRG